jgi:MoaA/NifB/PqqE/SkfB family radical SAM enzyme
VWNQISPWDTRSPNEQLPMKDLSFELLKQRLTADTLQNVKSILFNGRFGDPMIHPEILEICNYIRSVNQSVFIAVYTNGSLRAPELWKNLAKALGSHGSVYFSIDGLEDTNGLYRQKTAWDKIMRSARAFIENGGHAVWSYLIFEHNSHQVEEAQKMAKDMGFVNFEARKTSRFKGSDSFSYLDIDGALKTLYAPKAKEHRYELHSNYLAHPPEQLHICCDFKKNKKLFISAFGKLWPCSYVSDYYPANKTIQNIEKKFGQEFNDLNLFSIADVLHTDFFRQLPSSWTDNTKVIRECWKKCSVKHKNITSTQLMSFE